LKKITICAVALLSQADSMKKQLSTLLAMKRIKSEAITLYLEITDDEEKGDSDF
jgi:hypothetical protein